VDSVAAVDVAVVIPNYNGERWLPGVLESVAAQTLAPVDVLVVDDGSADGSLALLCERFPGVRVVALARNGGFARAANAGIAAVSAEAVALVNTDVLLAPDWLERAAAALAGAPAAASVATKLVDLDEPGILYDAGDVLRRDGACEQRGRFERDSGRYDEPGEVFSACAGAALYRRAAVLAAGGFDERFGTYLEDVDLGLRLRLAGWTCRWEPRAVARHAGGGSSAALRRGPGAWVERNTLLLVARAFRPRWLPLVAYRQLAWAWHAARAGRIGDHLAGARMALPLLPAMLRERRSLRKRSVVAIDELVPARPIRGPRAGGHPARYARRDGR
jgi:GT2 family glycosyltransferase